MTAIGIAGGRPLRARARRIRLRRVAFAVVFVLFVIAAIALGVFIVRYMPAIDSARDARATLLRAMGRLDQGVNVDLETVNTAMADVAAARRELQPLQGLLADDAAIAIARDLIIAAPQVRGADDVVTAASSTIDGADALLRAAQIFVRARDATGDPLPRLLHAMEGASSDIDAATASLTAANARLNNVPNGLAGPIIDARDELRDRLARILPGLSAYAAADDYVPSLFGDDGARHYLVIAEDPAELRPTGGFMGTFGIVTAADGAVADTDFHDVYSLDLNPDLPYVEPPADLKNHLLGKYSWQLADANWSPDFPTSAQDALRLYSLESGDTNVDGVIALTTGAIDELLTLTGPIAMPEYGVTVHAGQTLFITLAHTRHSEVPGENRKQFLDVLADRLVGALKDLPADRLTRAIDVLDNIRTQRHAMVWLADPALQQHVVEAGWDGGLRDDAGDYLMSVDSNVAPAGKLNSVVTRSMALKVSLDEVGNAHNSLELVWHNPIREGTGKDFDILREIQRGREILGNFTRIVVPERSRFEAVTGGSSLTPGALESQGGEAGHDWFGAYLMVPPGDSTLTWGWIAPYVTMADGDESVYRLTVQKQPGRDADPFSVTIELPPGATIVSATDDAIVDGATVTWTGDLRTDLELDVRYKQ